MFRSDEIVFNEKTHQYFDHHGEEYVSVSRLLNQIRIPFDRNLISSVMAKNVAEETGEDINVVREELLKEWEAKKESSIEKGNYIHDGLEEYAKTGQIWEGLDKPVKFMQEIFRQYYRFYPEVILYSHRYRVAGRTDNILQRQKSKNPVIDIIDYKTNESKGIVFDSASRKDGIVRHYNKYFLPPLSHMEDCNYNFYALQTSVYAFLVMEQYGCRIGKLGLVFFDNDLGGVFIPVPFMYYEAKILCEMNLIQKELPETSIPKPSAPLIITDDWA